MLLDGQSRQSAWPLRPPPNFLPQDPRVQEKEMPPQCTGAVATVQAQTYRKSLAECQRHQTGQRGPRGTETIKGDSCLSYCACAQGNGELWKGGRNDSGLPKTSRQRGGACVLLPALFMNVWLWLWLACGGECVSVNECRCAAVNERFLWGGGPGVSAEFGSHQRLCVCACEHACVSVWVGWARSGRVSREALWECPRCVCVCARAGACVRFGEGARSERREFRQGRPRPPSPSLG